MTFLEDYIFFDGRLNTNSGTAFYFDYKSGEYGWNSSSSRGADTFHPFKSSSNPKLSFVYSQNATKSISLSSCNNGDKILIYGKFTANTPYTSTAGLSNINDLTGHSSGGYSERYLIGTVTDNTKSITVNPTNGGLLEIMKFREMIPSSVSLASSGSNASIPLSSCINEKYYIIIAYRSGIQYIRDNDAVDICSLSFGGPHSGYANGFYIVKVLDNTKSFNITATYGTAYAILGLSF